MVDLGTPLSTVIGGRTAKPLENAFGIRAVGDLLRHYPRRMAERGELTDLASLRVDDEVTVLAEVRRCTRRDYGTRGRQGMNTRLEVEVGDGRGTLQLVFFGSRQVWREKELQPGTLGLFSGKVGEFRGRRQLAHPDYLILRSEEMVEQEADGGDGREPVTRIADELGAEETSELAVAAEEGPHGARCPAIGAGPRTLQRCLCRSVRDTRHRRATVDPARPGQAEDARRARRSLPMLTSSSPTVWPLSSECRSGAPGCTT